MTEATCSNSQDSTYQLLDCKAKYYRYTAVLRVYQILETNLLMNLMVPYNTDENISRKVLF